MPGNSFRNAQAVGDLVHHVKPLLAAHLGAVAKASGLGLAQTGEAFRLLRDDGFRFQRDEVAPLLAGLEATLQTGAEARELAAVVLLADAVQRGRVLAGMTPVLLRLRDGPASLRAAVANGLRQLGVPTNAAECQTRGAAEIAEPLLRVARSMRRDEIYAVAEGGSDLAQGFAGLMDLIGQRDGIFAAAEGAVFEVIVLGARLPKRAGYEGCTAVLLLNALQGGEGARWFERRWQEQGAVYCALQPSRRDPILAGVRYLYETDQGFLRDQGVQSLGRLGEGAIIPVVDEL